MEVWNGMKDVAVTTMKGVSNKIGGARNQLIDSTTNWAHGRKIPFEALREYFRNQEAKQRRQTKMQEYRRRYSSCAEQFKSSPDLLQGVNISEPVGAINVPALHRVRRSSASDILVNSCVSRLNLISTRKSSVCEETLKLSIAAFNKKRVDQEHNRMLTCKRQHSYPEHNPTAPDEHAFRRTSAPEQRKTMPKGFNANITKAVSRRVSICDNRLESLMLRRESFGLCGIDDEEKKTFTDSQSLHSIEAGKSLLSMLNTAAFNNPLLSMRRRSSTTIHPEQPGMGRRKIDSITDVELGVNQIQLTIHHEPKPNLLTVTIHRLRLSDESWVMKSKIFATVSVTSAKPQKKKSQSVNCEKAKVWEDEFIFKKMTMADLEESSIEIKIFRKKKFPKFSKYHSQASVALYDVDINDFVTTTKDLETPALCGNEQMKSGEHDARLTE